jgi:hypothetical protein
MIPEGICQCSPECGEKTTICTINSKEKGHVKGQYHKYAAGHNGGSKWMNGKRIKKEDKADWSILSRSILFSIKCDINNLAK